MKGGFCGFSLLHCKHCKQNFSASALQFCQIDTKNTQRLHELRTRLTLCEICGFFLLHGKHCKQNFSASALQFCQIDTKNTQRLHKLRTRRRCVEICVFSLLHGKHCKQNFCASALQFCQIDTKKHPTVAQIAYTADVVQKFFVVKKKKANKPF